MKKIVLSLLALAATMNIMAVTYSAKATITLESTTTYESCEMIVGQSDELAPGLNNGEYAEINMEGRSVALYVEYGGVKYQHFASAPETMTNLTLCAKTNSAENYNLIISNVSGTINLKLGNAEPVVVTAGTTVIALNKNQEYAIGVINPAKVYVSGSWAWDPWVELVDTDNDGIASADVELTTAQWYQFGLHFGTIGSTNGQPYTRSNNSTANYKGGSSDNMSLNADVAGIYTFNYEFATRTFSITFPALPTCDYSRNGLEVGRYYTICLPKAVENPEGASFWNLRYRNNEGTLAYLEEATGALVAGRPYIFQAEATELCLAYTGDAQPAGAEGALVGTLADMNQAALTAAGSSIYLLYNNELVRVDGQSGNSLVANRAYIKYGELIPGNPQAAPGRRVRAIPMQGQTATGVENLNAAEAPVKTIIDGKMYILRGEHMFDATGRMVK